MPRQCLLKAFKVNVFATPPGITVGASKKQIRRLWKKEARKADTWENKGFDQLLLILMNLEGVVHALMKKKHLRRPKLSPLADFQALCKKGSEGQGRVVHYLAKH